MVVRKQRQLCPIYSSLHDWFRNYTFINLIDPGKTPDEFILRVQNILSFRRFFNASCPRAAAYYHHLLFQFRIIYVRHHLVREPNVRLHVLPGCGWVRYSTTLLRHIRWAAFKTPFWRCPMNILPDSPKGEPSQLQSNHTKATGLLTAEGEASRFARASKHITHNCCRTWSGRVVEWPASGAVGVGVGQRINRFYQSRFNLWYMKEGICCTGTIKNKSVTQERTKTSTAPVIKRLRPTGSVV